MKVLELDERRGLIKLRLESLDDMYWLMSILEEGDVVRARTVRRVKPDSSRPDSGERVPVTLSVSVEKVDVDGFSGRLRITGVIVDAPEWLGIKGRHHTISISPGRQVTVVKEEISPGVLEILKRAEAMSERPRALIVVMDERRAVVAEASDYRVRVVLELSSGVPGKVASDRERAAALGGYFRELADAIASRAERGDYEVVIVAGPGPVKEEFLGFLRGRLPELGERVRLGHASTATVNGVYEVIKRGELDRWLREFAISRDIRELDEFMSMLARRSRLVAYGLSEVSLAAECGAVERCLISSALLFSEKRGEVLSLIESLRRTRAEFHIVDSGTEPGEILDSLGGVVAFLRFSIS
ncbi:MAG: mRNA surveillance protein pelota [Thermoproteota archaeon]|nr:MAG: mRNA surveillance protein pelota [Candidatus Korarchaeota archaeon]